MVKKKMLMVSLEDEDSKDIAQVITNKTCRKILDYLSQHDKATEGEVAKELSLPLSTTNYSIKQLIAAELIVGDEYNYSEKGKKVFHYKLANQFIIIAPKKAKKSDIKKQLKEMLGLFGVSIAGALGIAYWNKLFVNMKLVFGIFFQSFVNVSPETMKSSPMMVDKIVTEAAPMAARIATNDVAQPVAAETFAKTVNETGIQTVQAVGNTSVVQETFRHVAECGTNEVVRSISPEIAAIWFLIGAVFVLIVYLLYKLFIRKKENNG